MRRAIAKQSPVRTAKTSRRPPQTFARRTGSALYLCWFTRLFA